MLPRLWSVGLFSIDYSPFLNSTQPDLVLWYPKPDSDYQEAQKLTSFFNLLVWNKSSLLCPVVGYSVSMICPVYALSGCDQSLGLTFK